MSFYFFSFFFLLLQVWLSVKELAGRNSSSSDNSPVDCIVIGGFGMGGTVALHMLRCFHACGEFPVVAELGAGSESASRILSLIKGIFCINSYLPHTSAMFGELDAMTMASSGVGKSSRLITPLPRILFMHGSANTSIPMKWGSGTASNLLMYSHHTLDIQWKEYPGVAHEIVASELQDLLDWIRFGIGDNDTAAIDKQTQFRHAVSGGDDSDSDILDNDVDALVAREAKYHLSHAPHQLQCKEDNSNADLQRWHEGVAERKDAEGVSVPKPTPIGTSSNVAPADSKSAQSSSNLRPPRNPPGADITPKSGPPSLPFEIFPLAATNSSSATSKVRILYLLPHSDDGDDGEEGLSAEVLEGVVNRPIFACGGSFDLRIHPKV